ncbi:V-type ATP synthase subunit I [Atopobacter sp. AH10]|uniref:V-type ATP synthase subunit I n=1 Tax=Atopobacter sp. AH10 TaxID=2315861 RepID=UPI000EF1D0EF|nr:V-type ATP synthase subunit I [Atopobacter sp. AH10]RLK64030.1 V-type ATP synthase subunit I [Atopobacter sp. AH10]
MAIATMNKVTLIAPLNQKNSLLKAIQSLEKFEVYDLNREEQASEILANHYQAKFYRALESEFERIQSNSAFLDKYLPQMSLWKHYRKAPLSLTQEDLEGQLSQEAIKEDLAKVEGAKEELSRIADRLKELGQHEETANKWKNMNFHPKALAQFRHLAYSLGTLPQSADNAYIKAIDDSAIAYAEEIYSDKDDIGVIVFYQPQYESDVQVLLRENHFTTFRYPFTSAPADKLKEIEANRQELLQKRESIVASLKASQSIKENFILAEAYYYNAMQREAAKALIKDSNHLFAMEGWMEKNELSALMQYLKERFEENDFAILYREVLPEEVDQVPIRLKNNSLVEPFELLTEMFALPKYNEIDPTPFLMPFYCVFFGMMAADFGYGLVLWLGTLLALKALHLRGAMKKNIKLFHILSYPTMVWGLIFGSFFGFEMPVGLLSTSKDVNQILILSVLLGVVQIFVGLLLATHLKVKEKDYYGLFSDALGWLGLLIGFALWITGALVLKNDGLIILGKAIAALSALAIVMATVLSSDNKLVGLGSGLYNLYGISGYVGDIVSYTRLMALCVSGASIGTAFNSIITLLPGPARFTIGVLLFVALHGLNIFLSYLSAYVHGIRLQFVEFFGKFYEGGGKAFQPLKMYDKDIEFKK